MRACQVVRFRLMAKGAGEVVDGKYDKRPSAGLRHLFPKIYFDSMRYRQGEVHCAQAGKSDP